MGSVPVLSWWNVGDLGTLEPVADGPSGMAGFLDRILGVLHVLLDELSSRNRASDTDGEPWGQHLAGVV
jgi:hypothetical protein